PRTGNPVPSRTSSQILEAILSLPEGAEVELRAPVFPIYGEDIEVLYAELRKKGVRRVIVDGETVDLSDTVEREAEDDAAVYADIGPAFFQFNNPESACRTCGGLGVDKLTHPDLLVPDPDRSILGGCFVREAFKYNPDTWDGRLMFSLSNLLNFQLDTPWRL